MKKLFITILTLWCLNTSAQLPPVTTRAVLDTNSTAAKAGSTKFLLSYKSQAAGAGSTKATLIHDILPIIFTYFLPFNL